MSRKLSRRALLATGVALVGTAAMANAPLVSIRPQPRAGDVVIGSGGPPRPQDRIVARPSLENLIARADLGGETGVVISDVTTGDVLEAHLPDTSLMPASVTKAVTALYAFDALGESHRFATRVLATGPIVNGVVQGDLVLAGGGDPVLDTDALAALLDQVIIAGITGVTGRFVAWAGGLPELREIDAGQLEHLGYNPGISGLNLNFNRVHFEWARNGGRHTVAMDARSETLRPEVTVARMQIVDRSAPVYAYADDGTTDQWSVARSALGDAGSRWLPVRRPALYVADVFRSLARAGGLVLPAAVLGTSEPAGFEVARHESPPLEVVVRGMLRFSTNLTAEVIGRAASQAKGVDAASLPASGAAMSAWLAARYGVTASFVDHSGLGDASRISAADMVKILAQAQNGPLRRVLRDIPLVDDARDRLPNPRAEVVAKTGTLNFVSTLAGYVDTVTGQHLAFAIFSADPAARDIGKRSGDEQPRGSITFNTQAKRMQMRMLRRWARMYSAPADEVDVVVVEAE